MYQGKQENIYKHINYFELIQDILLLIFITVAYFVGKNSTLWTEGFEKFEPIFYIILIGFVAFFIILLCHYKLQSEVTLDIQDTYILYNDEIINFSDIHYISIENCDIGFRKKFIRFFITNIQLEIKTNSGDTIRIPLYGFTPNEIKDINSTIKNKTTNELEFEEDIHFSSLDLKGKWIVSIIFTIYVAMRIIS